MRKLKLILLLMVIPMFFITPACEEDIEDPDACYELTIKKEGEIIILTPPYTIDAGRKIIFENCGYADFYSFFNGTPGHVWAEYQDPTDTLTTGGETLPGGDIEYTYLYPGDYTATMVLTNRQVGDPYNIKQVTMEFVFTITEPEE